MYSYFNPNPNGRNVSDCTVRAICKATGKDWGALFLPELLAYPHIKGILPKLQDNLLSVQCFSLEALRFFLYSIAKMQMKKFCNL